MTQLAAAGLNQAHRDGCAQAQTGFEKYKSIYACQSLPTQQTTVYFVLTNRTDNRID